MASPMAAVFDLNEPAHVVHWHFFQMSVSNIVVILAMLVVFALAILIPFPGAERRRVARESESHPPGAHPPGTPPGPPRAILDTPSPARIENEP